MARPGPRRPGALVPSPATGGPGGRPGRRPLPRGRAPPVGRPRGRRSPLCAGPAGLSGRRPRALEPGGGLRGAGPVRRGRRAVPPGAREGGRPVDPPEPGDCPAEGRPDREARPRPARPRRRAWEPGRPPPARRLPPPAGRGPGGGGPAGSRGPARPRGQGRRLPARDGAARARPAGRGPGRHGPGLPRRLPRGPRPDGPPALEEGRVDGARAELEKARERRPGPSPRELPLRPGPPQIGRAVEDRAAGGLGGGGGRVPGRARDRPEPLRVQPLPGQPPAGGGPGRPRRSSTSSARRACGRTTSRSSSRSEPRTSRWAGSRRHGRCSSRWPQAAPGTSPRRCSSRSSTPGSATASGRRRRAARAVRLQKEADARSFEGASEVVKDLIGRTSAPAGGRRRDERVATSSVPASSPPRPVPRPPPRRRARDGGRRGGEDERGRGRDPGGAGAEARPAEGSPSRSTRRASASSPT
jgi:hypothetical protein